MPTAASRGRVHFPGLNSMRFVAAMFVVIGHIPMNQGSVGLPAFSSGAFFYRGSTAVSFFFALSGFLISYLLLDERERTGTVSVSRFYLRRVLRIWPVYFLVIGFGLLFYNAVLPATGIDYPVGYSLPVAVALYVFFLPNLMNSLYSVGGILNPTWSIGVEEQFYLTWAPAFRRFGHRFQAMCWTVLAIFLAVFVANHYQLFGAGWPEIFFGQIEFHFMAAGGLCAWWLYRRPERFLALPVFRLRWMQVAMMALLAEYYLVGLLPWGWLGEELVQVVLYCWVIVNVAANPRNVVPVGKRLFDYPGKISYGVYMFHMIAVYATSFLFLRWGGWQGHPALFYPLYYATAIGATLILAHLSYQYFEKPFLRLKDRRFAPDRPAPTVWAAIDGGDPL